MINLVDNFIKNNNLVPKDETILVALSGGSDSMFLLHALYTLGYKIVVAHVNHKKRLESDMEEENIKLLCKNLNIKCFVHTLLYSHKDNFHNEAHNKRYGFFMKIAKENNISYIATAHHQDDNLETILLNMISGSNLYGYGGISYDLIIDDIHIIRPLYNLEKEKIRDYMIKNNLTYYEDSSNLSDDYLRNRLRHHVVPLLKAESKNILTKTSDMAIQIHEAFNFIRNLSINYLKENNNIIDINTYLDLDIALKKDILCLLLETYNIEKNSRIILSLLKLINNPKPNLDYNLKGNMIFKKRYSKAYIELKSETLKFQYTLENRFSSIKTDKYEIFFSDVAPNNSANYIKLCYNNIAFPIIIRNRDNEDEMLMAYGHKKLKKIFIDKKINKEERESLLVIADQKEILWVYNIQKSARVSNEKSIGDIYLVVKEY